MEKRAISTVVATVLIILITVAAVTIIWAAVIPLIKNKLAGGNACMDAQADLSLVADEGYTCIKNNSAGNISVQVKRGAGDFDLVGIQFIISVGGTTKSEEINATLGQNEGKVFNLINDSYKDATNIQIAPIIKAGNVETTCGVSERATLEACA